MSAVLPEPRTAEITDIARAAVRAAIRAVEQHGACAVCQERLARLHEQYPDVFLEEADREFARVAGGRR